MIDKIDRPDIPQPYRINEAKHTKENQHQGRGQQEEGQAKYQQQENKEWQKFHRTEVTIKPMKIKRADITRCLYRHAYMRSGSGTLVGDLIWKNGQTTEGALLLLRRPEDYLKLRHYRPGQNVPEEYWASADEIEIGIPHIRSGSGPFPAPELGGSERSDASGKNKKKENIIPSWLINEQGKPQWGIVLGIIFMLLVIILAGIQML